MELGGNERGKNKKFISNEEYEKRFLQHCHNRHCHCNHFRIQSNRGTAAAKHPADRHQRYQYL